MSPVRFLTWVLGVVFTMGLADSFGRLTYRMAQAAVHAHAHDQMSYAKFSKMLWTEKTRYKEKRQ